MLQRPDCQTGNPDDNRFCRRCGAALLRACPECDAEVHIGDSFCGRCSTNLKKVQASPSAQRPKSQSSDSAPLSEKAKADIGSLSERKHVSVLFSDLTGYTSMSEKLDPEEVKEITSRMFIAPVWITNGQMRRGVELLEKTQISLHENQRRTACGLYTCCKPVHS